MNVIHTEKGVFNVIVNVRDKGLNQYVYEVKLTKKGLKVAKSTKLVSLSPEALASLISYAKIYILSMRFQKR